MRLGIKHFVATSVLAHAAALVAWAGTQSHSLLISATPASAPVIEVALLNTINPVKPSQPKSEKYPRRKPQPLLDHPAVDTHTASTVSDTAAATTTAVTSAYPVRFRRDEVRDRVLSKIRSNLQQYFVYPLLARRQGWQGKVLLGFSVEADGMIRNIHVAAGSGYTILDTSAVDALSRVHNLYELSEWMQGERLDMEIPVIFRLQGG